ncbi:D-alanyl-D-alanine dipeptidase [Roseospira marina]|uniref:D-alanyl-D-alanine dipeptidase n=1 Tax=Roseospira marina TaxID=140057 RepID=A0A5M6IAT1_9PROT|nr:D-alanyl-D-alanine dipeptidase [Roseospira marina]KAA5605386.1 D-alanyl-D-alanine dipeptidase [Roseospira marina]MBB4314627.1 D-alanyl-D-alanine dipeptidase [Roseospira marina]MBB5088768.1 D-alanyl-D-alanine dipeptidase [Roseospira marina]
MLIEITPDAYDVDLDLRYATADNIAGRPIYARAACYLHMDAAALLGRAVALARPLGLRLRVFDAFRPAEAQWVLWDSCPDPEFLADPRRGSPHSMGAAIDLTLVDGLSGEPLDMGTGFDATVPESHHGCIDLSVDAQRNRALLLGLMTAADWDFYRNEWWHYQLFKPRGRYPVLTDAAAGTRMMPGTGS